MSEPFYDREAEQWVYEPPRMGPAPQPPRIWVHRERSYDQRAKAIIAFNTCKGDLDDKLEAAWLAALAATPQAPKEAP